MSDATDDLPETKARIQALRCTGGPHSPDGWLFRHLADEIERLRAELAALRALITEAREREQRYVLPLYRDANYLARLDAALAAKEQSNG